MAISTQACVVDRDDLYDDDTSDVGSTGTPEEDADGKEGHEQGSAFDQDDYEPKGINPEKKFSIQGRHVFVTYIQCETKDATQFEALFCARMREVATVLDPKTGTKMPFKYYGSQEKHEDGNPHYHVVLQFERRVHFRDAVSRFQIWIGEGDDVRLMAKSLDIRPRYRGQSVSSFLENTQAYCAKDSNTAVFGEHLLDTSSAAERRAQDCRRAIAEPDYDEARALLEKCDPVSVVWKNPAMRSFLADKKRKRERSAKSPFPRESFLVTPDMQRWFDDNFEADGTLRNIGLDRYTSLVLVGPARTGKSEWATSFGDPDRMRESYNVTAFSDESTHLVVDDIPVRDFPVWKAVIGCQRNFDATGKYSRVREVRFNKPTIWLCNADADPRSDEAFEEYTRTGCVTFVEIEKPLFKAEDTGGRKRRRTG